jgi:hypothetical protein
VAALAGLIAHGGLGGAIAESLVALAVAGVLIAVWLRERRPGEERKHGGAARLRDDDDPRP